jgi:serine/threonine protein kinase
MLLASAVIRNRRLDELHDKYAIKQPSLGQGSYGFVYAGRDKTSGEPVAIKVLDDVPDNTIDSKRLFREIMILGMLQGHPNIVSLKHIVASVTPSTGTFLGMALIFERYEADLSRIICSKQNLTKTHLQYFLYQILTGVYYIHSAGFVHRDLKPANILVNENCDLAICDFGLARATQAIVMRNAGDAPIPLYRTLTDYVVTRWYRCPELAVGNNNAGEAPADMWSIGCILAELLLGEPLFAGAEDNVSLIDLIVHILGTPTPEDCAWIQNKDARARVRRDLTQESQMNQKFCSEDTDAVDLLKKLLHFNPSQRITAKDALQHSFITSLHHEPQTPLEFPIKPMSKKEKCDLNNYYVLERESENCDDDWRLTHRIHALIKEQIEPYAPEPPPPAANTATSSPSHTHGTVFNDRTKAATTADSQQVAADIPRANQDDYVHVSKNS